MRLFIRHPVSIPIEVADVGRHADDHDLEAYSLGQGGLAFRCECGLATGTRVRLRIPWVEPAFESEARVVWCHEHASGAELGVEFLNTDDAFRARMVAQVCHIEDYRRGMREAEGRELSAEEAAHEWLAKYAARFPNPGTSALN